MYRKIRTLSDLNDLANQKRSVFRECNGEIAIHPAAWVMSMQARIVHRWINAGLLLYTKGEKSKAPWEGRAEKVIQDHWHFSGDGNPYAKVCGTCIHLDQWHSDQPCSDCVRSKTQ